MLQKKVKPTQYPLNTRISHVPDLPLSLRQKAHEIGWEIQDAFDALLDPQYDVEGTVDLRLAGFTPDDSDALEKFLGAYPNKPQNIIDEFGENFGANPKKDGDEDGEDGKDGIKKLEKEKVTGWRKTGRAILSLFPGVDTD
jgi:hypothetical protein